MGYGYLFVGVLSVLVWGMIAWLRPDLREDMLVVGCAMGFAGVVLGSLFFTKDWWHPETVTGTAVGIEDALHGFGIGGIAVALYRVVFRKRSVMRYPPKRTEFWFLLGLSVLIGCFLFFGFGVRSYYASFASMLIPTLLIYRWRSDLIAASLFTGVFLALCMTPGYLLVDLIDPGYIRRWWLFDTLTRVTVIGVPIEDILFYFFAGLSLAPICDFWRGSALEDILPRSRSTRRAAHAP
jgi:hypothetical protein